MITTAHFNAEVVDDQATVVGFSRTRMSRIIVGAIPRTSQRQSHSAVRTADGSYIRTSVAQIRALRRDNKLEVSDESDDG